MNSDFKELLQIFAEEGVEYLIVGATRYCDKSVSRLNPLEKHAVST